MKPINILISGFVFCLSSAVYAEGGDPVELAETIFALCAKDAVPTACFERERDKACGGSKDKACLVTLTKAVGAKANSCVEKSLRSVVHWQVGDGWGVGLGAHNGLCEDITAQRTLASVLWIKFCRDDHVFAEFVLSKPFSIGVEVTSNVGSIRVDGVEVDLDKPYDRKLYPQLLRSSRIDIPDTDQPRGYSRYDASVLRPLNSQLVAVYAACGFHPR